MNFLNDQEKAHLKLQHKQERDGRVRDGWIKKGVRKEIPANTGRSRLNLSGAIDILNHHVLIQENQTLVETNDAAI